MPKIEFPIEKGGKNRCKLEWINHWNFKPNSVTIYIDDIKVMIIPNQHDLKEGIKKQLESGQMLKVSYDKGFVVYLDDLKLPAQYAWLRYYKNLMLKLLWFVSILMVLPLLFGFSDFKFENFFENPNFSSSILIVFTSLFTAIFGTFKLERLIPIVVAISVFMNILVFVNLQFKGIEPFLLGITYSYFCLTVYIYSRKMQKTGGADFYKKSIR